VEALRGSDALIYRWLQSLGSGLELTVIPVLVRMDEIGPEEYFYDKGYFRKNLFDDGESRGGTRMKPNGIFPASETVIQFTLQQIPKKHTYRRRSNHYYAKEEPEVSVESLPTLAGIDWKSEESLPFFPLSKFIDNKKKLSCTLNSHGGHGGNDSRPSEAESIYLHRAIIVRRRK
jgi:hypothetical protein